jgi:transcriptional regulator with XRE-family HTH domain
VPSAGFGDSSGREFGTLLRHARERAWLSQQQLADRCGLSVKTINNLESGPVARPRIQSVRLLADELELSNSERSDFEKAALGQVGGRPRYPDSILRRACFPRTLRTSSEEQNRPPHSSIH